MTDEDIAKGIVYSSNFDTLIKVPNQISIRISNLTKTIYGSSESDYAFLESTATLKSFTFMDNPELRTIGPYAFYQCSQLQNIDLSLCSKLETIQEYAFDSCKNVKSILLPNQCLTSFGSYAFHYLGATKITIPRSLKTMSSAFYSSSLKEMTFEEGCILTGIGSGAISYSQIYNLTIPPSVTSVSASAFEGTKMRYINVHPDNKKFTVLNNVLYDSQYTILIYSPKLSPEVHDIPESVTQIGYSSFLRSLITEIVLPPKLTSISGYSFFSSKHLQRLSSSICIPKTFFHSSVLRDSRTASPAPIPSVRNFYSKS